jgi:hypothetical protein
MFAAIRRASSFVSLAVGRQCDGNALLGGSDCAGAHQRAALWVANS